MRNISAVCLSMAMVFGSYCVNAQGDSDPGLASTGAMRTTSAIMINQFEYENQRPSLSLSHEFAKGERDARLNISKLATRLPLKGVFSGGYFDVQLPIVSVSGELAKTWGIGDITATYNHMFLGVENWTIQGTAGFKWGMTTADVTDGSVRPLPMSYQTGTGSTDFIIGGSATWLQYLTVAAGYQMPFFRYNENSYYGVNNINDTNYSRGVYPVARKLYRQGDAMLRVEGHYITERVGITGGILGMYHVLNDLYQDRNTELWHEIEGSQGFTINAVGNAYYRFGRHGEFKFDLTAAAPLVRRDVIPDGTAKEWSFIPRLTFFFNSKTGSPMF